jgi:hypothetical protein
VGLLGAGRIPESVRGAVKERDTWTGRHSVGEVGAQRRGSIWQYIIRVSPHGFCTFANSSFGSFHGFWAWAWATGPGIGSCLCVSCLVLCLDLDLMRLVLYLVLDVGLHLGILP